MADRSMAVPENVFGRITASFLAMGLLLAGFPGASALAAEKTLLRVSAAPYLTYAPLYIAEAEGFFDQEGLKVEFLRMVRHSDFLVALLQGDVDVDEIMTAGVMNAMIRGEKIRVVASRGVLSSGACVTNGFLARPGLAEKLDTMSAEELKRLTFGVNPTWLDGYFLHLWLSERGLSLRDVRTEYLAAPPSRIEALRQGALDVVFMGEPWITRALDSKAATVWKPASELAPGFPLSIVTFGPTMLERKDDAGVRFMRAYLRAVRQYAEGKTDRNIEILSKATEMDPELLKRICWTGIPLDGKLDPVKLADYTAWAAGQGYVDRPLAPEEIWEPKYVEEAGRP